MSGTKVKVAVRVRPMNKRGTVYPEELEVRFVLLIRFFISILTEIDLNAKVVVDMNGNQTTLQGSSYVAVFTHSLYVYVCVSCTHAGTFVLCNLCTCTLYFTNRM